MKKITTLPTMMTVMTTPPLLIYSVTSFSFTPKKRMNRITRKTNKKKIVNMGVIVVTTVRPAGVRTAKTAREKETIALKFSVPLPKILNFFSSAKKIAKTKIKTKIGERNVTSVVSRGVAIVLK